MGASSEEVTVLRAEPLHTLDELAALAEPQLAAAGAELAMAFGAYARGTADGYSDLDLAVVLKTDLPTLDRWRSLRGLLEVLPVPVDLLVYTPEEWARGLSRRRGIFDAISREGVTIYARC